MRVWVDLTNSPHVLVFRPLIRLLRERGHEVEVTAREYAQTLQLLELHGIEATPIGRHGGASALGKHGLTLTARSLGIASATTFDYEYAWLQHQFGARAATRVLVPEAIPAERLAPYGLRKKLHRYAGLKEEYYLADFEPSPVEVPAGRRLVVARTPPEVSLFHRHVNPLFLSVLELLGKDERAQVVVLPRTDQQRAQIRGLRFPSFSVPD